MTTSTVNSNSGDTSSKESSCSLLPAFNVMVLDISDGIVQDKFRRMKILCDGTIKKSELAELKTADELIFKLRDIGKISNTDVEYLIQIIKKLKLSHLVEILENYQKQYEDRSGRAVRRKSVSNSENSWSKGHCELLANLSLSTPQRLKLYSAIESYKKEIDTILAKNVENKRQLLDEAFEAHCVRIERITNSSIVVVLLCKSYSALMCFQQGVMSGSLGNVLTHILVTDEIRSMLEGCDIDPEIVISVDQSCFEKAEEYFKHMHEQASLVARVKEEEKIRKQVASSAPIDLIVQKLPSTRTLTEFRDLVKVVQKKLSERRSENDNLQMVMTTLKIETMDLRSSTEKVTSQAVKIGDFLLELSTSGRYRESMVHVNRQVGWLCPSCSDYNTPMRKVCVKCDIPCPNTYERPDDHWYLTLLEESLNEIKSGLLKEESSEDRHLSPSTGFVKRDSAGHFKHGLGEETALEINTTNKSDIHCVSSPVTVSAKPTIPPLKTLFNTSEDKMYVTQLHTLRNLLSGRQIPQAVSKQFDRPSEIFEYLLVKGYLAEDDVNFLKEVFTVMDDEGLINLVTEYERREGLAEKESCNLSVTEAKPTIPPYKILFDILDESMDVTQLRTLRNLLICRQIPLAASKQFNRPSEIFEYLLYVGYITEGDVYLLKDVFTVMDDEGLVNLVTEYERREGLGEKETCNLSVTVVKPTIPPLKILFNILDENMDVSQLRTLRSLLSGRQIPQAESKQYNRPSEIFEYLLYMGSIKEGDLNLLKEVFTLMDDEKLVALVTEYERCKGLPEN
ncbi:uncharacterized protein [Ptychodera flava]|uniref:uncharacterized protein n=1 Tax=Ptychodera flava TaxID=63121 RepID=UPI00396A2E1F